MGACWVLSAWIWSGCGQPILRQFSGPISNIVRQFWLFFAMLDPWKLPPGGTSFSSSSPLRRGKERSGHVGVVLGSLCTTNASVDARMEKHERTGRDLLRKPACSAAPSCVCAVASDAADAGRVSTAPSARRPPLRAVVKLSETARHGGGLCPSVLESPLQCFHCLSRRLVMPGGAGVCSAQIQGK